MSVPYALIADVHLHEWSAFASTLTDGTNSRLAALLVEIGRAADAVRAKGGKRLVIAGDLFHVRGQISPKVLNPVVDLFADLIKDGFEIVILAGNHDLASKDWTRLGSGVTALEKIGCEVAEDFWEIADPDNNQHMILVSWIDKLPAFRAKIEEIKAQMGIAVMKYDLIIHAPINGVIKGLPDTGLDPAELAGLGFKRVFAGHYHNHVSFPGEVYSIGALAHHTWSDVGSQAGFCLVYERQVDFHPSSLPQFVDIQRGMTGDDIKAAAKGNYVRVKMTTSKAADLDKMRELLMKGAGALGVSIVSVKAPTEARDSAIAAGVNAGASLEQSVAQFIQGQKLTNEPEVLLEAARVLSEVVEEV